MRAYIEISKENLIHNYKTIKDYVNKDMICVIKSNAYGHGLIETARILSPLSPKMFAVSTLEEAALIRKNLIFTPVLLLGVCDNLTFAYKYHITLTIINLTYLKNIAKINLAISIHLLINTGMNRDGIEPDELLEALEIIKNSKLILKGVFTHFVSPETYNTQFKVFSDCLKQIPYKDLCIHSNATSTMLEKNDTTAVRIGLALFGLIDILELKPVLSLKSLAINEIRINAGQGVSYSNEKCEQNGFVYTLPLGYADGINRKQKLIVFANDTYLEQIGVTCMDHLMVFSKNKLPENTIFEIISNHITVKEIAEKNETISYEIVSHLSPRLKRIIK